MKYAHNVCYNKLDLNNYYNSLSCSKNSKTGQIKYQITQTSYYTAIKMSWKCQSFKMCDTKFAPGCINEIIIAVCYIWERRKKRFNIGNIEGEQNWPMECRHHNIGTGKTFRRILHSTYEHSTYIKEKDFPSLLS